MADLTAISAGLDAIARDVEKLTLQQLSAGGRIDQRIQKVDLALRPVLHRLRLLFRGLREHRAGNEGRWSRRWNLPRQERYRLKQSIADRGRRIDQIAAKLAQIRQAIDELYGAAGAPRTEQDIISFAKQAGDFADEFQELQALVLSHANEVADGLRGAKPQMSYGGLMATLTFMLLLLWRRNR